MGRLFPRARQALLAFRCHARVALSLAPLLAAFAMACGGGSPDARYPARRTGCAVQKYASGAEIPVDELGVVSVDCDSAGAACERRVLDAVCARGGDVAWGFGDNALSATHVAAHAAHSKRAVEGARAKGCAVRVFADAPSMRTENVGSVTAFCADDDTNDVCLRELEDQVCGLGGDVLWQVEGPSVVGSKMRMRGQAAHSR